MPPKKIKIGAPSTHEPKNEVNPTSTFCLRVGESEFKLPMDCVRKFPNTTLGAMLESFDNSTPSDLDFPGRNPSVFEKIVVPFYTSGGSLDGLQTAKIIEIQSELDYWGIPTSARNLSITAKDLQNITKENEGQSVNDKKKAKISEHPLKNQLSAILSISNSRLVEARAEQRIADTTYQATKSTKPYMQILLDEALTEGSPKHLLGSDLLLYKYWVSVVGADRISFLSRTFEFKDRTEKDLPNPDVSKDEQEDFYDDYQYSYNPEKRKIEEEQRWQEWVERAYNERKYGPIISDYVFSHGVCIETRQGEYNDETYPLIETYSLYVMIVSWE